MLKTKQDVRSIEVAAKYGIDITKEQARKITVKDFDTFDTIYAMDANNYQNILSLSRNKEDVQKVKMILNESFLDKNLSVPDPYYGGKSGFEDVYKMLAEACEVIASKISSK